MKKLTIKTILIVALAAGAAACTSMGRDRVTTTPGLSADDVRIWDRPHSVTLDIQPNEVTDSSSTLYILGITFGEQVIGTPNLVKLNAEGGPTGYGPRVLTAAAKAQDAAKADAFQIKRANEEVKGLWPFFWTDTATVWGNPIMLRFKSVSAEEADTRRVQNLTGTGGIGKDPCLFRLAGLGFFCG